MRDLKANLDMKWYTVGKGTDPQLWESDPAIPIPDIDEETDVVDMLDEG